MAGVRDVAAAAQVSVATVSRYLNGKLVLPPETAARIDAARLRLNYRANPHAQRLSRGRSDTLGLVIPDIANPFFAVLADAIQREAELEGMEVLIAATRNRLDREVAALDRLGRQGTDGVLFVTNHADDGTLAQALCAIPHAVLLDEDVTGTTVPKLFADNLVGGRLAAEHLLAQGHRRVAILGGPAGLLSAQERHRGFQDAIAAGGGAVVFTDSGDYTIEAGRRGADAMLASPACPTAVFATSDQTALGMLDAARMRGVAVPGALSLIGFDDIGPWHLLDPALTVIRQPVEELGRRGVQLLLATIAGREAACPPRLPVELIVRASVAPPRAPTHAQRGS